MATRLKRLEEMYLDTSPLTHLPGGIAIENVLKKRIESGRLFAFCLIDLDNFKAYNDHYGYARGYAVICKNIVEEFDGNVDSLYDDKDLRLGHIIRKSRTGEENKFPLMTISIGVVTNKKRKLKHFVQVGEIAAEVKNYAKSKPGSLYYVDRRNDR